METNNKPVIQNNEISIIEIIETIKKYYRYLLSKWIIICIFGFGGAAIGLVASFLVKPKYTAHLSFALIEKAPGGGLADLASSFGFAGLISGNQSAFSGDNLLEIIKSRYAIEKTLLTPVYYYGKKMTLVEAYIDFSKLREKWKANKKKIELSEICFPNDQKRETFTRTQDSVLYSIYFKITNSNDLTIIRKSKKNSIVNISYTSHNEVYSKLFIETLMNVTYQFYKETKTSQSKTNIDMMQHTADSIKSLYESALFRSAGYSQVNINEALQFAAVPKIKQQTNAQLYGTVYAEVLKNLETLKLEMARETPLVQIIDSPVLPLKKIKIGKFIGTVFGGLLGGIIIVLYLLGLKYIDYLKS